MPEFSPWDAARIPLLEDERPYRDAKRNVTIPPIRFHEPDPLEDDAIMARFIELRKRYAPKKREGPGRNGAAALFGKQPAPPVPLFGPPKADPNAPHPLASNAVPQGAFDNLPPEARAGIVAGIAEKTGGAVLYAGKDGVARQLSENLLANIAALETMYVPAPGDQKPYDFDGWVGHALNYNDAYRRMVTVCAFLRRSMEPPPVGEELKAEWQEVLEEEEEQSDSPPVAGAGAPPTTQPSLSNSATPTPTPPSTPAPPSAPAPPPCAPHVNSSEPSPTYSPDLTAALASAASRLGAT